MLLLNSYIVALDVINNVKLKCCGIKVEYICYLYIHIRQLKIYDNSSLRIVEKGIYVPIYTHLYK